MCASLSLDPILDLGPHLGLDPSPGRNPGLDAS